MLVTKDIDINKSPSNDQMDILSKLETSEIVYDDDCPELSADQLKEFHRISADRRAERRKQSVTLRLSPRALNKAKSLGKGYTSVLSRILESALEDNELIEKYL